MFFFKDLKDLKDFWGNFILIILSILDIFNVLWFYQGFKGFEGFSLTTLFFVPCSLSLKESLKIPKIPDKNSLIILA